MASDKKINSTGFGPLHTTLSILILGFGLAFGMHQYSPEAAPCCCKGGACEQQMDCGKDGPCEDAGSKCGQCPGDQEKGECSGKEEECQGDKK